MESDPVGLRGGLGTYTYVDQDPIIAIDPFGRFPIGAYVDSIPFDSLPFRVHGYWCGPNWTGGYGKEWNQLTPDQQANASSPGDPVDAACMNHDKCYGKCRATYPCDATNRAGCFRNCDFNLMAATYSQGRIGFVIGFYFEHRKAPPGPNASSCPTCGGK
jgi:hypothetical protein